MFIVPTELKALKPPPVMVSASPGLPEVGETVMLGPGIVKDVVPVMLDTVAVITSAPGVSEPPAAAAGTVMVTVKAPEVSVAGAGIGSALAVPKFSADRFVWLGKPVPETVTVVPVEPVFGDADTLPAVIDMLFVLVLFAVKPAVPPAPLLSVAVMVIVSTAALTGMVTLPVNVPLASIGNGPFEPVKAPDTLPDWVRVTLELTPFAVWVPKPAPVMVIAAPGPPELGLAVTERYWMLKPEDVPTKPELSVAVQVFVPPLAVTLSSNGTLPVNRNVPSVLSLIDTLAAVRLGASPATPTEAVVVFSVKLDVAVPAETFTKPDPETVMAWPGTAEVGVTVIVRFTIVNRNEAVFAPSFTTTVFVPVLVALGTENLYGATPVVYVAPETLVVLVNAIVDVRVPLTVKSLTDTDTVDPGVASVADGVALAFCVKDFATDSVPSPWS